MEEFWRAQVVLMRPMQLAPQALLKRALACAVRDARRRRGPAGRPPARDGRPAPRQGYDVDPWLGMQAASGISSGQNVFGKALMAERAELREQ